MSDKTDSEPCSLITNMCKQPKHFDFPEHENPFKFGWFKGFHWVCYSLLKDGTLCLPFVSFGHKNVENFLQKTVSKMSNRSKNIQKTPKRSNRNTQKEANLVL